jgi:hypothetical protein
MGGMNAGIWRRRKGDEACSQKLPAAGEGNRFLECYN